MLRTLLIVHLDWSLLGNYWMWHNLCCPPAWNIHGEAETSLDTAGWSGDGETYKNRRNIKRALPLRRRMGHRESSAWTERYAGFVRLELGTGFPGRRNSLFKCNLFPCNLQAVAGYSQEIFSPPWPEQNKAEENPVSQRQDCLVLNFTQLV